MGGLDPNLLSFLAGAGLGPLLETLAKLMQGQPGKNPNTPSAQLPHRAGLRVGAGGPPNTTTLAPSMLQALLAQTQGGQPNQQQMLAQLAQQQGGMPGV